MMPRQMDPLLTMNHDAQRRELSWGIGHYRLRPGGCTVMPLVGCTNLQEYMKEEMESSTKS